jgi:single-strand DNA-binding protein
MSNDMNQCNFTGRLGADPETRYLPDSKAVTSFSLAVGWKSKDKEGVEWVRVVSFGKQAEIIDQYCKKGTHLRVTGKFRTKQWEKDGQKHYTTEIVAHEMQMLDSRGDQGSSGAGKSSDDSDEPPEERKC